MNYSTLQEAYNVDTFEKKPRPSQKQKGSNAANATNTANAANAGSHNTSSANTSPSFIESSKLAMSSSSCSPLQAPAYNIPISNDCKKEHADAMNVYLEGNDKPPQSTSTSAMTGMLNLKGGNSGDNVMPYYDEDLEQYFNISDLNDEVKYNSHSSNSSNSNTSTSPYMPNSNKQSYTNNDTAGYTNNNAIVKQGNNLLNNTSYNLTPEEKKSAEEAIAYLKSIEEKINKNATVATADPVVSNVNTGPGGFKTPTPPPPVATPVPVAPATPIQEKSEKYDNYIYNAIFNISILLIIGIAIILLCDQMVELAIQIGMKRAVYILEPYIKAP